MSAGRQYLTPRQWREKFEEQGEHCALCPNTEGPFIAEHEIPNYFQPGKPNRIICTTCDKPKTRKDRKDIAHVKRLNGETQSQYARREARKAEGRPPLLQGRGFPNSRNRARTRAEIMGHAE